MIKPRVKVERKINLTKAIEAALERAHGSSVQVGVFGNSGRYRLPNGDDGPDVSQVALWNEYGTINMPARPFFGPAFTENRDAIDAQCAECLRLMIFENWTVERALNRLGLFVQILIQNKIRANPGPDLTGTWDGGPDQKGTGYLGRKRKLGQGQVRLIATGLLLRSVNFKVSLSDEAKDEAETHLQRSTASGHSESKEVRRARNRATAAIQKEANAARRSAHKEEFKAHQAAKRAQAKAKKPGTETAHRTADGKFKTRVERAAFRAQQAKDLEP